MNLECVVQARGRPAEGPIWDPGKNVVWWVDINGKALHKYDPKTNIDHSVSTDQMIGAVATTRADKLVGAVHQGFAFCDPATGALEMIHTYEQGEHPVRMNDGKVDSLGRFWAGTLALDLTRGAAMLYRLDPDHSVHEMHGGRTVSNGIGWSPDDRLMYYIDTRDARVDVFDFDVASGSIANKRTFVDLAGFRPDGLCVDAEGCVWVALFGGSCVRRYGPDATLNATVELPVTQVTSCCFGGDDLADLYITTAATRLTDEQLEQQPLAGSLFRCRPGVRGLPPNAFGG